MKLEIDKEPRELIAYLKAVDHWCCLHDIWQLWRTFEDKVDDKNRIDYDLVMTSIQDILDRWKFDPELLD